MELHAQIACAMPRELARKGIGWQDRAVYTEAIYYGRENLTDGVISRGDLPFWMADMPVRERTRRLDALRDNGALLPHPNGWCVPEHVWRKWGKTRSEVESIREARTEAGLIGNHERWHTGATGKPSHKCPLCIATRSHGANGSDSGANRVGSPKPKPEPKPEPEPSSLTSSSTSTVDANGHRVETDQRSDHDEDGTLASAAELTGRWLLR
jgi:hypothetical protein